MKYIFLSLFVYGLIKLCYEDTPLFPWITGDDKGLVLTEMHIVEKKLNIKFNLVRLPWKRCQLEAESGNIDGIIAASYNKHRTSWGVYPTKKDGRLIRDYRLHTESYVIYKRKESKVQWENGRFLNLGKSLIGTQLGYSVVSDLKDAGYAVCESFSSPFDILKELDINTHEVAVLLGHESAKILQEHPKLNDNIIKLEKPFKVADQYLLFTRKFYSTNKNLIRSIWIAISKARRSNEYLKNKKEIMGTSI